jgi:ATP-dependent DNA helicase DinG
VVDELDALVRAAGGRTLALFTSYRAMHRAVDALRPRLPHPVLAQGDLPKPRLVDRFASEPETCLFATMSYWQGIDVPGPSLSLVTIDRLPFPRPDDPLLQARRDRAGDQAFTTIDVPRAATLLAQGTGRLIRTATDRGAVAILDPRLATARYGPKIVAALPRMRRTRDRAEVERFLRQLRGDAASA